MKITIDQDFYITKDATCYTLNQAVDYFDTKGNQRIITHGYFNTLTQALQKLKIVRAEKQLDKEEVPLSEYIQELRNQTEEIRDLMRGLEEE